MKSLYTSIACLFIGTSALVIQEQEVAAKADCEINTIIGFMYDGAEIADAWETLGDDDKMMAKKELVDLIIDRAELDSEEWEKKKAEILLKAET